MKAGLILAIAELLNAIANVIEQSTLLFSMF